MVRAYKDKDGNFQFRLIYKETLTENKETTKEDLVKKIVRFLRSLKEDTCAS